MKRLAILVALLALGLSGCEQTVAAPSGRSWPVDARERLALEGISGKAALVRDAIARVSSGDQQKAAQIAEIANYYAQVAKDEEELRRLAQESRHLDVALVQSGATWVEFRR